MTHSHLKLLRLCLHLTELVRLLAAVDQLFISLTLDSVQLCYTAPASQEKVDIIVT